jgi:hypothetical protein
MPVKKIDTLRDYMSAGQWHEAIKLAAKFPRLGEHKVAITRAKDAIVNPGFCRQLGRDPDALIVAGIAALQDRYSS